MSTLAAFVLVPVACAGTTEPGLDNDGGAPVDDGGGLLGADVDAEQPFPGCATSQSDLGKIGVYMQFIVDHSGSMEDPISPGGPTGVKWTAAKTALEQFFSTVEQEADPNLAIGMFIFDFGKGLQDFTLAEVPIRQVNSNQANLLRNKLRDSPGGGGTPLKRSIEGQLPILTSYVPQPPVPAEGRHVLVLMTDGVPDGSSDIKPRLEDEIVQLIENARMGTPPVTTFAVGIGNPTQDKGEYNEVFMGRLAEAGGTAVEGCLSGWNETSPSTSTPCHFQVTPGEKSPQELGQDLLAAFNTIRSAAASCEYRLNIPAGTNGDPTRINVVYKDAQGKESVVPQNEENGWTYDNPSNPTKVRFHGDACRNLRRTDTGTLRIVFGCKTTIN